MFDALNHYATATTVKGWVERLPKLAEGYAPRAVVNMVEFGVFFKALPDKCLRQKGKSSQGGKKSKKWVTLVIFVSLAGEKYVIQSS